MEGLLCSFVFSNCSFEFSNCSSGFSIFPFAFSSSSPDSSDSEDKVRIDLRDLPVDWTEVSLGVSRGRRNTETLVGRGKAVLEAELGSGKSRTTNRINKKQRENEDWMLPKPALLSPLLAVPHEVSFAFLVFLAFSSLLQPAFLLAPKRTMTHYPLFSLILHSIFNSTKLLECNPSFVLRLSCFLFNTRAK